MCNNTPINEADFNAMPSIHHDRPAQIPIRKDRLEYLIYEYSPKETDKWVMFNHPHHFLIYERETKNCIYDLEYLDLSSLEESNPIVAVVSKIRINRDSNQHMEEDIDDFSQANNLISKDF